MALLLFAIDPFGRFGPILRHFLLDHRPLSHLTFPPSRPNATAMYSRIMTFPCPKGILPLADLHWPTTQSRQFFGHSYTAPTPSISTLQDLGLCLSKAFASHIRFALKRTCDPPPLWETTILSEFRSTHHLPLPPSSPLAVPVPIYIDHPR